MNRRCERCDELKAVDLLHYNKQQGWICNDRQRCSVYLEGRENKKDKPWKRLYSHFADD